MDANLGGGLGILAAGGLWLTWSLHHSDAVVPRRSGLQAVAIGRKALKLAEERLASKNDDTRAWRLQARATALGPPHRGTEIYTT